MFPEPGPGRWAALHLQAICDGLMDAAVLNRYEIMVRPESLRWAQWSEGQMSRVDRVLGYLESVAESFDDRLDIGTISCACACGYLDFRYADRNWRASHPQQAAWFARFEARPSMQATLPPKN